MCAFKDAFATRCYIRCTEDQPGAGTSEHSAEDPCREGQPTLQEAGQLEEVLGNAMSDLGLLPATTSLRRLQTKKILPVSNPQPRNVFEAFRAPMGVRNATARKLPQGDRVCRGEVLAVS